MNTFYVYTVLSRKYICAENSQYFTVFRLLKVGF